MSTPAHDDPTFVPLPTLTLDEARTLTDEQLRAVFGGDLTALAAVVKVAGEHKPDAA
jgi:hypothetical protein